MKIALIILAFLIWTMVFLDLYPGIMKRWREYKRSMLIRRYRKYHRHCKFCTFNDNLKICTIKREVLNPDEDLELKALECYEYMPEDYNKE